MSIAVDLCDLASALARFGDGYLLTTDPDGRTKVMTVDRGQLDTSVIESRTLRVVAPGRGTIRNITERPNVTLVMPPPERHGYTLLIDGSAAVDGADAVVAPTSAVLHRPASHSDGPPAPVVTAATECGNDCRPLD